MILLDKGYYDYDFSEPKGKHAVPQHKRTHEQTQALFSRMGFGKVKQLGNSITATELQKEAMAARERKELEARYNQQRY